MTNINTFQGDVFIHEYIKHTGDDNNLFGFSGTDTFKIATAGVDAIKVDADQNVDITGLIRHIGDENNLFGFSGADTFKIATGGTDRLTVAANGTVTVAGTLTAGGFSGSDISTGTVAAARVAILNQNTTGSAATLTTARTIGGVSFNGSGNINLPGVNTAGNQNTTGSAATLTTARTIGGVSFNGSGNINLPGVNAAGNQNTSGLAATATKVQVSRDDTGDTANYLVFAPTATAGQHNLQMDSALIYDNTNNRLRLAQVMFGDQNVYGLGAVSGTYGSVGTVGTGKGSYEGYSINGEWVFMSNGAGSCGIYNDTNNEWAAVFRQNAAVELNYNNTSRFQTTNDGAHCTGNLYMNNIYVDQYIYHTGDTNTYQMFNSDNIRLYVGGTHTLDTNANMSSFYNSNFRSYKTNAHPYLYCQAGTATYDPHLFIKSTGAEWAMWNNGSNTDFNFYCSNGNRNTARIGCVGNNTLLNFTGQHRSFVDGVPYTNVNTYEGQIVSANNERYIGMNDGIKCGANAITINEALPVVSISNVVNDKTCFGVISTGEDPDERGDSYGTLVALFPKEDGDTRIYINSVGEGAIWVTDLNGNIEAGDYITTSNIAGYGQKQDDDILHNYTVAKATMSCDFNPPQQPVKQIAMTWGTKTWWELPGDFLEASDQQYDETIDANRRIDEEINEAGETVYIKKFRTIQESNTREENWTEVIREQWVNTLDSDNLITFEENGEIEAAYKIRYLATDGQITDEANAVHTAAFVGCTYHCG